MDKSEEPIKELNACIGKQILRSRNAAGKSQKDITLSAGFSVSLLNKYETGENLPSIPNLLTISDLLNTPVDALLQDYHSDFIIYAIDSYLARIDKKTSKSILEEVRRLFDGE